MVNIPTYAQDSTIFIELDNINSEIENKVLPPYVKLPLSQVSSQGISLPHIE